MHVASPQFVQTDACVRIATSCEERERRTNAIASANYIGLERLLFIYVCAIRQALYTYSLCVVRVLFVCCLRCACCLFIVCVLFMRWCVLVVCCRRVVRVLFMCCLCVGCVVYVCGVCVVRVLCVCLCKVCARFV